MKHLLTELPPLSARGWSALVGAVALALVAMARRENMKVPRELRLRLVLIALLTVGTWASLIALSLLWLRASEAAVIAASMPVWVSLLALAILHEHFSLLRAFALAIAMAGLAILFGADGFEASVDKLPGAALAITATLCVALGTVLTKRFPFGLPAISLATWQIAIGCLPIILAGLVLEAPNFAALSAKGWLLMAYMTFVQFCVCYALVRSARAPAGLDRVDRQPAHTGGRRAGVRRRAGRAARLARSAGADADARRRRAGGEVVMPFSSRKGFRSKHRPATETSISPRRAGC